MLRNFIFQGLGSVRKPEGAPLPDGPGVPGQPGGGGELRGRELRGQGHQRAAIPHQTGR